MDRNLLDVVIEILSSTILPPEEASKEERRLTFLAARQLEADSNKTEGRNQQICSFLSLDGRGLKAGGRGFDTGGRGFDTGGKGGPIRVGGKAGDTFLSEIIGFSLSTETLSDWNQSEA